MRLGLRRKSEHIGGGHGWKRAGEMRLGLPTHEMVTGSNGLQRRWVNGLYFATRPKWIPKRIWAKRSAVLFGNAKDCNKMEKAHPNTPLVTSIILFVHSI